MPMRLSLKSINFCRMPLNHGQGTVSSAMGARYTKPGNNGLPFGRIDKGCLRHQAGFVVVRDKGMKKGGRATHFGEVYYL